MSDVFAVISDPHRRAILAAVAKRPQSVNDLVALTKLEQPAVSKHLKALRDAELVDVKAAGQSRIYHATLTPLQQVADFLGTLRVETTDDAANTRAFEAVIGDAGEVVGNWLAAGAEWLGSQVQAQLADRNIDPKNLGRELGRKLADAKSGATDYASDKEAELMAELEGLVTKVSGAVKLPARKPAAKKPAARKAATTKVSNDTTQVRVVRQTEENEDEF